MTIALCDMALTSADQGLPDTAARAAIDRRNASLDLPVATPQLDEAQAAPSRDQHDRR